MDFATKKIKVEHYTSENKDSRSKMKIERRINFCLYSQINSDLISDIILQKCNLAFLSINIVSIITFLKIYFGSIT